MYIYLVFIEAFNWKIVLFELRLKGYENSYDDVELLFENTTVGVQVEDSLSTTETITKSEWGTHWDFFKN